MKLFPCAAYKGGRALADLSKTTPDGRWRSPEAHWELEGRIGQAECCTLVERCQSASEVLRQHSDVLKNIG